MEVEAGAAETGMPQQELDAAQVNPRFEQMRREAMAQEMRINHLRELGGVAGLCADMGDAHAGDGLGDAVAGKEPGLELIELPVAPQQRQQVRREHHQAIAFPLALADLDDHAFGVDVRALELTEIETRRPVAYSVARIARCLRWRGASSNAVTSSRLRITGRVLGFLGYGRYSTIHGRCRVVS